MAREGVSPVEIASPPAAEREARDADPAAGREPSSTASPVGSEVRAPPEAEERAAPRADHERERVDDDDDRPEADWDDVLERLARLDRDLDKFVARRDDGELRRFATTSDPTPTETRDDPEPPLPALTRATAFDTNATESIERESIEREREREPAAASRAFVARLAASMTSSLEGDASAEETRAARAEAVAAVEAFYDALLRTRPEKPEKPEKPPEKQEKQERHERAPPMHRALEIASLENVFAKTSRVDDSVANLRRVLETL